MAGSAGESFKGAPELPDELVDRMFESIIAAEFGAGPANQLNVTGTPYAVGDLMVSRTVASLDGKHRRDEPTKIVNRTDPQPIYTQDPQRPDSPNHPDGWTAADQGISHD